MTIGIPSSPTTTAHRGGNRPLWTTRLGVIAAAAILNVAYLLIITDAAGYDLKTPAMLGSGARSVPVGMVAVASVIPALLAWGILHLLERFLPRRATVVWGTLATVVLIGGLPFGGSGVSVPDRLLLGVMHAIVGRTVIPTFVSTSRHRTRPVARHR